MPKRNKSLISFRFFPVEEVNSNINRNPRAEQVPPHPKRGKLLLCDCTQQRGQTNGHQVGYIITLPDTDQAGADATTTRRPEPDRIVDAGVQLPTCRPGGRAAEGLAFCRILIICGYAMSTD